MFPGFQADSSRAEHGGGGDLSTHLSSQLPGSPLGGVLRGMDRGWGPFLESFGHFCDGKQGILTVRSPLIVS